MKKTRIAGLAVFAILAIACTQFSIVTVGGEGVGATGLVRRTGSLSYLHFIDSAKAVCRDGRSSFSGEADVPDGGRFGPRAVLGARVFCEGGVAIQVAESGQVVMRMPYSSMITSLSLLGRD